MDPEEAKRRVLWAVMQLVEEERNIIARGVHEQTITGHLVGYLRPLFVGYNVDAEYNLDYEAAKKLNIPPRGEPQGPLEDRLVKPDILVHRRDERDANGNPTYESDLVVIEAKKEGADGENDARIKLRAFMQQHFQYKVAAFLCIEAEPGRVGASVEFIGDLGEPARMWRPSP